MDGFIKETTMYTGSLGAALLISYAFHVLATRFLGVVGYGTFSKYFGLLSFLTLPTFLVQSYVAREIASGKNPMKSVLLDLMKILIPIAVILPLIDYNFAYVSVAIVAYAVYIYRGYLQGKHDSKTLSLNLLLEPIFRVGFLVLLVYFLNLSFGGALLSFTLAYLIVLLPGLKVKWGNDKSNLISLLIFIVVSVAISIPTTLGITLASNVLPPAELSQYSILLLLSKLMVFLSFSVGMAYLPLAVENNLKKKDSKKEFHISIYILIAAALIFIVFPQFFAFFFPEDYHDALVSYLPLFSVSMLLIGVSYIIINKMWAQRLDKYTLIPALIFIALEIYFTSTLNSLHAQAIGLFVSSIILLSSTALINFLSSKLVRA